MMKNNLLRIVCLAFGLLLGQAVWSQALVRIDDPETWQNTELSRYIGQTVRFDRPFYITNNTNKSSITISPRRVFVPTDQAFPKTADYTSIVSANQTATVSLSGVEGYHRMGERIVDFTAYVSSSTRLELRGTPMFSGNTRDDLFSGIDDIGSCNLKVCAMNLEYYLVENIGSSLGPANADESDRQHTKIINALAAVDADVYGLVEIEAGQTALRKLATSLTERLGRNFDYVDDGGRSNGTYTKVGYIYCTDRIEPYGKIQSLDNPTPTNRKKAMAFVLKENGEKFIFSMNHFKAKSGSGTGADADQKDGQGQFNATRTKEAKAVVQFLETMKANYFRDEDVLVMGDLNAYAKEDPIKALIDAGYTDLHRAFHADSSYTYTYRGQAGYLDHALANSSMRAQVTGMTAYHINSDESDNYTYDKSTDLTMFRSSDHDPVIVGLALGTYNETPYLPFLERVKISRHIITSDHPLTVDYAEGAWLQIHSLLGQLVYAVRVPSDTYTCYLQLPAGVYVGHLYGEGRIQSFKLIVQ